MTFTEAVPEATVADCIERGVTSFKLYLAWPAAAAGRRRRGPRHAPGLRPAGGLVTVHCENGGAIEGPAAGSTG